MNNQSDTQPATIVALTGANQTVTYPTIFMGIAAHDEGTGNIEIHVYHGQSDTGSPLAVVKANTGAGGHVWYGPNGILCPNGLFIKVYTGTPSGCVFVK